MSEEQIRTLQAIVESAAVEEQEMLNDFGVRAHMGNIVGRPL